MRTVPYDDPANLLRVYSPEECDADGYPFLWPKISAWVRQYANEECSNCVTVYRTEGDALTVHHRDSNKADCRKRNLKALCWTCHYAEWHSPIQGRVRLKKCPHCRERFIVFEVLHRHILGRHANP